MDSVIESYPAVADSVPLARRALGRLAAARGAAADQIDAVRLAVSEAMTHAVVQTRDADTRIRVRGVVADGRLSIHIEDDRSRVLPEPPERGLGPGLGLALIAHASDELAIAEHRRGGTALRMRFAL